MMKTEIERVTDADLLSGGPYVVVVALDVGDSIAARYRGQAQAGQALPAGQPLAAIIRPEPLSTPDQIRVVDADGDGRRFRVELEVRRYTGPIAANVETVALVQVELGSLPPGDYEVEVVETTMTFADMKHPEQASAPTTDSRKSEFQVR